MASLNISYVEKKSFIHKLNPLTKLIFTGCIIILSLILRTYIENMILFILIIPLAMFGKILTEIFKPIKVLFPVFILLFLIQGLFYPYNQTVIYNLPFELTVGLEGVQYAALISSRLLVMLVYGYLFVLTTHPGDLVSSLREIRLPHRVLKMPYSFGYLILATLQMIPRMQSQMSTIIQAQMSRGLNTQGNIIEKLKAYVPLTGPLFLSSVQQAVERSIALESRAFSADVEKTSYRENIVRTIDYVIQVSVIILSSIVGVLSWIL